MHPGAIAGILPLRSAASSVFTPVRMTRLYLYIHRLSFTPTPLFQRAAARRHRSSFDQSGLPLFAVKTPRRKQIVIRVPKVAAFAHGAEAEEFCVSNFARMNFIQE